MSRPTLIRANTTDIALDGRTLEGMALYWNRPSRVTDDGVNYYRESFRAKSVNKTLAEKARAPIPLGTFHPWQPGSAANLLDLTESIGDVRFVKSASGLVFRARIHDTPLGADILELVKSGEWTDVSIGFKGYQEERLGDIRVRTEIGITELSLAPTGRAQHAGTKVLAVRALVDLPTPNLDKLNAKRINLDLGRAA